MMMAVTADGKIAHNDSHFPDWTSREDKKLFAEVSKKHKVLMMGEKTYNTLPGPLKGRLNVVFTLKKDLPETAGVKWVEGDPVDVLKELEKEGYTSALLGGGTYLNTLFLKNNLIDEIILTVEPKIFGSGLSLFDKQTDINLELKELKKINSNAFMVTYRVIKI